MVEWIDWDQLHRNVDDGTVLAAICPATASKTGQTYLFTESARPLPGAASGLRYVHTRLGPTHALAGSAIPLCFEPVHVQCPPIDGWFMHGAVRLHHPLKPVVQQGVDRLLILGTQPNDPFESNPELRRAPDLADAMIVMLNANMEDSIAADVRALEQINLFSEHGVPDAVQLARQRLGRSPLRPIPFALVDPPRRGKFAAMARQVYDDHYAGNERPWREPFFWALNRATGGRSPLQDELLSLMLFAPEYMEQQVALGKHAARKLLEGHESVPFAMTSGSSPEELRDLT